IMKAIVVKELRENAKWALLILLALGAAMAFALSRNTRQLSAASGLLILDTPFQMCTVAGFAAAGLALGLLQLLQDARRGRWAFVTHRPVSPGRIFAAKVVAGLLLYLASTCVPLAAAVAWVATPGHVAAPFEWHMLLPALADLFGGIAWYAAGLYVG